jgi:hypothetical protein
MLPSSGINGFELPADDLFVAVGCVLGRLADEEGRDPDTGELPAPPWFRQGSHYKQLSLDWYEALASLTWPVDGRQLATQESTPPAVVRELLDEGLVTQLPASDDPGAWEHVFHLRVLPHSVGLGQTEADHRRFIVISRAFPWLSEPESDDGGGLALSSLDYFIWTSFDGVRSLGEVVRAGAERAGLTDSAIRARIPALFRALLTRGLISVDLVVEPPVEA